jgi:hypothetical protein
LTCGPATGSNGARDKGSSDVARSIAGKFIFDLTQRPAAAAVL